MIGGKKRARNERGGRRKATETNRHGKRQENTAKKKKIDAQ